MNAWPALESVRSDGWVFRFSEGYTRRANSVHPLDAGSRDLAEKIAEAERLYRAHGLPSTFKMTQSSQPAGLDAALAGRGYAAEAGTSVRIAGLGRAERCDLDIEPEWSRTAPWREAFHRMKDVPRERRTLHDRMLSQISSQVGYAAIGQRGRIVACALGIVEAGWLGIFDVVVDEGERRRGHGERLMRGLLSWGRKMGAEQAYLQVMLSNEPALSLYEKLGFREAYQYWYRVKHPAGGAGNGAPEAKLGREQRKGRGADGAAESAQSDVGHGFSYRATREGEVLIQRSGRTVTYLRHDAARCFLAEVDGAEEADAQETMARYTGNYKRGNERLADEHPRHQKARDV